MTKRLIRGCPSFLRIVLDRIRTVDKRRLVKKLGRITRSEIEKVKDVIKEMLVD